MSCLFDNTLVLTPHLQVVQEGSSAIIWHSLFGNPKVVDTATLELLDEFRYGNTVSRVFGNMLSDEESIALQELVDSHYLNPVDLDERQLLASVIATRQNTIHDGSRVKYLELIISEACNFRCLYCIHFNNLDQSNRGHNSTKIMSFETAKEAVDRFLQLLESRGETTAEINFGGGEPLLGWNTIHRVLEYCATRYSQVFSFRYSLNTNASLLTPQIAQVLKDNAVEVATSLDGNQVGNDAVRQTKIGHGTYEAIVRGFETLSNINYPLSGVSATITADNYRYLDTGLLDWMATRGMTQARVDIDVIGMVDIPVADIVSKLIQLREHGRHIGVDVTGFWARAVENLNDSLLTAQVAFCGAVRGNSLCINPVGQIYVCGYSNDQIGQLDHWDDIFDLGSRYAAIVQERSGGLSPFCHSCVIEGQCGGGCKITQEFAQAAQSDKVNRMCEFYCKMSLALLQEKLRDLQP